MFVFITYSYTKKSHPTKMNAKKPTFDNFSGIIILDVLIIIMSYHVFQGEKILVQFSCHKNLFLINRWKGLLLQNIIFKEPEFWNKLHLSWINILIQFTSIKRILYLHATYKFILFLTHWIRWWFLLSCPLSITQLSLIIMDETLKTLSKS